MQATIEDRAGVHVVHIGDERMGELDSAWVRTVTRLLDIPEVRIAIDLSAVKAITSSALGSLVTLTARANQCKSQVVLASPSAFVAGVLETTKLNRFFQVFATVDAAVIALA